jgi:hypothetical protein
MRRLQRHLAVRHRTHPRRPIIIDISDGTGDVTVFSDATTISLTGNIDDDEIDEEQLFTAKGDNTSGEDGGNIELEGNCSTA